jgi:hypothetical protein
MPALRERRAGGEGDGARKQVASVHVLLSRQVGDAATDSTRGNRNIRRICNGT